MPPPARTGGINRPGVQVLRVPLACEWGDCHVTQNISGMWYIECGVWPGTLTNTDGTKAFEKVLQLAPLDQ